MPAQRRNRSGTPVGRGVAAVGIAVSLLTGGVQSVEDQRQWGDHHQWNGYEAGDGSGTHARFMMNTSKLIGKCFNFPDSDFALDNSVNAYYPNDPTPLLPRGGFAVDFVLPDLDDETHQLRELLRTKPVVLIYGMATCPAFQGMYLESHQESHFSKYDQWALVDKYHEHFHFVNLYSTEPHPMSPDKNFDTGMNVQFDWSTFRQARTYKDRGYFARTYLADDLHEENLLLIDNLGNAKLPELEDIPEYNPVWCTYGPGSRMAFLIGQDGKLYNVQAWFHATTMAGAMEEHMLLAGMNDLDRKRSSSKVLDLLTTKRELAYARMEKSLKTTLDMFGQQELDYEPSPHSRDVLLAEAAGRLEEYVAQYADAKEELSSMTSDLRDNPSSGWSLGYVMRMLKQGSISVGLMAVALVVAAVVAMRRSRTSAYSTLDGGDEDEETSSLMRELS